MAMPQVAPAASNRKGSLLIPPPEVARVMSEVAVQPGPTGLLKLAGIKNIVEGWCAAAAAAALCFSLAHSWRRAGCVHGAGTC